VQQSRPGHARGQAHPDRDCRFAVRAAMFVMTASFRVTVIQPEDSTVTLIQRTDNAVRAAKKAECDRVSQVFVATVEA